jgi:hypothetical protein
MGDGGGETRRSSLFRGSAARSSPEFAVSGPAGVNSNGVWVREDQRAMRDPPGHQSGLGEALGGGCDGEGGTARRGSPACACALSSGLRFGAQQGAWVCARPKRAYARPTRGGVVLQRVRHGGSAQHAVAEHRQPVFLPLGWPTCQNNWRKR